MLHLLVIPLLLATGTPGENNFPINILSKHTYHIIITILFYCFDFDRLLKVFVMRSSYVAFSLVPRDYARPHALLARQNSSIDPSELPAQCQSSCTTTVNLFSVRLYVFPSPIFLISYILLCLFIHVYPPIHSLNLQLVP